MENMFVNYQNTFAISMHTYSKTILIPTNGVALKSTATFGKDQLANLYVLYTRTQETTVHSKSIILSH